MVRVPMYVDSLSGAELRGGTRMRVEGIGTKSRHVSRQNMTVVVVECTQAGDSSHHHVRSSGLMTLGLFSLSPKSSSHQAC